MAFRDLFYRSKALDRIYMNVLRPAGYLLLLWPKDYYECLTKKYKYSYLQKYENIHKGERCFIVGTGPSLKGADLELIKNEIIFGVNALCLWKKFSKNIDYFFIGDDCAYKRLYNDLPEGTFVANQCIGLVQGEKHIQPLPINRFNSFWPYSNKKFSLHVDKVIYSFNSVIFLALQMAIYMGFENIYLLGVDCNYHGEKLYAIDHQIRHQGNYMKDAGQVMIENFMFTKKFLERHKVPVHIFNAADGGMLEVFPRVHLKEILSLDNER